jgi:mannitol-specific phosphotransferase system IIBC component
MIRLALFFAVFAALYWGLRFSLWLAAVVAAVVAFCIAYLFLNRMRSASVQQVQSRVADLRNHPGSHKGTLEREDEEAEDRYQ